MVSCVVRVMKHVLHVTTEERTPALHVSLRSLSIALVVYLSVQWPVAPIPQIVSIVTLSVLVALGLVIGTVYHVKVC